MAEITRNYFDNLPEIYRHIFNVYGIYNPSLKPNQELAWQTIYAMLRREHSYPEVSQALQQLVDHGVLDQNNDIFYQLTELGDQILVVSQEKKPVDVEPFELPH